MTISLYITVHESYSDCEDCGSYSNTMLGVKSHSHPEFAEIESGTSAGCFGTEEANYYKFVDDIFEELKKHGYDIPMPEWKNRVISPVLIQKYQTEIIDRELENTEKYPTWGSWPDDTNWDVYWEYKGLLEYPYEENYYSFYNDDFSSTKSFVSYLQSNGIDVIVSHTYDEIYDARDWWSYDDDDNEDEE